MGTEPPGELTVDPLAGEGHGIGGRTVAAFFDFDRTLISVNSGNLWVRRERRLKRLTLRQLLEAVVMLVGYRLSLVDMDASMKKVLAVYRGVREADLAAWTRDWVEAEVRRWVSAGARRALEEHRAAGHLCVLLTSSSPYLAAAASEHLGLDGWISSRYQVVDGVLTGEPTLPICFGAGKVLLAENYARERGVDLGRSYFYTDSYTDLPMLLRVGEPRVVNPDLRLHLWALRRRLKVLSWL
jgi:HAD superfamily hydrolase (TIGR01490 family)